MHNVTVLCIESQYSMYVLAFILKCDLPFSVSARAHSERNVFERAKYFIIPTHDLFVVVLCVVINVSM